MPLTARSSDSTTASASPGRRERNKQEKLDRITAAASQLFAERGVDEVTTQEVADRADIGTGTLFLYAKTKGELLLLVQNSAYADALEEGQAAAATITDTMDAIMAIVRPVVTCNRKHVANGRTYLRELVFGDPAEPHHREALALAARTQQAIADILRRDTRSASSADTLAGVVNGIAYIAMTSPAHIDAPVDDIVTAIRHAVRAVLPDEEPLARGAAG
jgi:AcrR family transcriptional regulator